MRLVGDPEERKVGFKAFSNQFEGMENIGPELQKVLEIMLIEPSSNYISGLGSYDANNVIEVGNRIVQGKGGVVYRIVFGASEEVPLRALSYVIPSLELMSRLKDNGFDVPQLQVIFANHISGGLNGLDLGKVRSESFNLASCISRMARNHYSGVFDSIVFLEDQNPREAEFLSQALYNCSSCVKETILSADREILAGKGSGETDLNYLYAGAHLLVHDFDIPMFSPVFASQELQKPAEVLISFGGIQEKLFYKIRHEVRTGLSARRLVPTLQYFTRHHVPPYYMARGGDISLNAASGEILGGKTIAKAAESDLSLLVQKFGGYPELFEFLEGGE